MTSRDGDGLQVLYSVFTVVSQTFLHGAFCVLFSFWLYILLKNKTKYRVNKSIIILTVSMFLLTTVYWSLSIANVISEIKNILIASIRRDSDVFLPLFNALVLVNFIATDSVVVWRAWVLCKDSNRKLLITSMLLLFCASVSTLITIASRVASMVVEKPIIVYLINVSQVANRVLSLLANIIATSLICCKAVEYRRELGKEFSNNTKVKRVLIILIESGFIYCASSIIGAVAPFVHLPHGTLGTIYIRVHVEIAGIYPTLVLILVQQQRTIEEGGLSGVRRSTSTDLTTAVSMNFHENDTLGVSTTMSRHSVV